MPSRKKPTEVIADLEKKAAQINARLQKEKAKVRDAERKADTRRKIIAGALAIEHAGIDPAFGDKFQTLLDRQLTKPADRELFGLPAMKEAAE